MMGSIDAIKLKKKKKENTQYLVILINHSAGNFFLYNLVESALRIITDHPHPILRESLFFGT